MLFIEFTIWLFNIAMENPLQMEVSMGKSSINGSFSMAMLNNQMVIYRSVQWNGETNLTHDYSGVPFWESMRCLKFQL